MLPVPFENALVLTGPTGSGKTGLGVELAERLGAEIISMDSMALYRGMDIGTAKPGPEDRGRIAHHLIDVLWPWESASVAWWLEQAVLRTRDIESRGKRVLFVGGTPLYLKALRCGLFEGPPADPNLRRQLTEAAERDGPGQLHARLAAVDPAAAARLHANDVRRIVRALEVWQLTGKAISAWQQQWTPAGGGMLSRPPGVSNRGQLAEGRESLAPGPSRFHPVLWLDLPRPELYARINARVEQMFAAGLVDEVRALRALPQPLSRAAAQALGYKEVLDHLDGRASLEETIALVQTRTRNFAKRQLSWFRHLPACFPVHRELTFAEWGLTIER